VDVGRVVGPARSRACRWSITSRCFRRECSIVARRARCVNGPKGALSRVYSPSWFRVGREFAQRGPGRARESKPAGQHDRWSRRPGVPR
jgi:hypothetical protein